jgi:hypothetical protein
MNLLLPFFRSPKQILTFHGVKIKSIKDVELEELQTEPFQLSGFEYVELLRRPKSRPIGKKRKRSG